MPRRRRKRQATGPQPFPENQKALTAMFLSSPRASIVDSDEEPTSLPDSVCMDYYEKLVEAGLDLAKLPEVEPLDLTADLDLGLNLSPEPSVSPSQRVSAAASSEQPSALSMLEKLAQRDGLFRTTADKNNLFVPSPGPFDDKMFASSNVIPALQLDKGVNPFVQNTTTLSAEAKEFVPGGFVPAPAREFVSGGFAPTPLAKEFIPGAFASATQSREKGAMEVSGQTGFKFQPIENETYAEYAILDPLAHLTPSDQKAWELLESQAVAAFRYFKAHPTKGTTFACLPTAQPKIRLGMHRCAEVLGATSASCGKGIERHVVITWNKDESIPIGEAAVLRAVRGVLRVLFKPAPRNLREQRRVARRNKKLAAEAEFRDETVDLQLLEKLIAAKDWYAIESMYQGASVPSMVANRRKKMVKKDKRQAKEARRNAAGISEAGLQSSGAGGPNRGRKSVDRVTEALLAPPLETNNKGFSMLEKMGWQQGQGLGRGVEGIRQPIKPDQMVHRAGLGKVEY